VARESRLEAKAEKQAKAKASAERSGRRGTRPKPGAKRGRTRGWVMADEPNKRDAASGLGCAAHRGRATWGARLVPLERVFALQRPAPASRSTTGAARRAPRCLIRGQTRRRSRARFARVAVCGGVYSNHLALAAFLEIAAGVRRRGRCTASATRRFGPSPESVRPLLAQGAVRMGAGQLRAGARDRPRRLQLRLHRSARQPLRALSYRYTAERCSAEFKTWMGGLPERRRFRVGQRELLAVHGSPRRVNEFLFDSTTPDAFLELLLDARARRRIALHAHRAPLARDAAVGTAGGERRRARIARQTMARRMSGGRCSRSAATS
jgi:hypothetical protein